VTRLPSIKPREAARVAEQIGFIFDRQKGSHAIYYHRSENLRVVIPMHSKDLKPGTLRGIITDLGLTVEEFIKRLR
jgi:predicted RNA binding protein YcfA (HicA-like mRNA interferase family)